MLFGVISRFFLTSFRSPLMSSEDEKQEGKGFTVQDRRRFSPETGEAREEVSPQATASAHPGEPAQETKWLTGEPAVTGAVAGDQFFDFCHQPEHSSVDAFGRDRQSHERQSRAMMCRWRSR